MSATLSRGGQVVFSAIFALAMTVALGSTPAAADDKTVARDHWEHGTKFYDLGKYDDAIREFEAAYEAKSDPAFLYNLAQSHRLAGHPNDALRFYRTYLRYVPKASNRADIEAHIKELEKVAVDHPTTEPASATPPPLTPGNAPPPAGVPPSAPAATPTAPQPSAAPNAPWPPPDTTTVPPANTYPYGTGPTVSPGAAYPPAGPPQPPPSSPPASGRRTAGIVVAASGGGLFVVGAIFGLVARNQSKKVETAASNNDRFDPSVESLGKTSQALQWVGYGVGVVAMAAGLFLYATAPAANETAMPRQVAIAPVVSQNAGGALLRVTF